MSSQIPGVREIAKDADQGFVSLSGVRTLLAINAELLEALKRLAKAPHGRSDRQAITETFDAHEQAAAAIAKAEGK